MPGHAGRLVDGNQMLILVKNRELARRGWGFELFGGSFGSPQRRQAHDVAGSHPGIGLRPTPVHPDFTAANDAVDMGFGDTLELANEKVVEPLPRRFGVNRHRFRPCACRRRRAPYNVFH